jgi:hypothetical protein
VRLAPATRLRTLGVWLDPALRWSAHREAAKTKAKTRLLAITRLTQSTWGARLPQSRHLLAVVLKPVATYSQIAWFDPCRRSQPTVREFDKRCKPGVSALPSAPTAAPPKDSCSLRRASGLGPIPGGSARGSGNATGRRTQRQCLQRDPTRAASTSHHNHAQQPPPCENTCCRHLRLSSVDTNGDPHK